jgi:hypothetical protein
MATPVALTPDHLIYALVPVAPDDTTGDPRPFLGLGIDRIDALLGITDAWKGRLPILPAPPAPQTLQELVQAARRRVRADRVRVDTEELEARRFVLQRVQEALTP